MRIQTRYRLIAPDMRSFGDAEPLPIDATERWSELFFGFLASIE